MKIDLQYMYFIEGLVGRNRVNTTKFRKTASVTVGIPALEIEPFLVYKDVQKYWKGEEVSITEYYNVDGKIYTVNTLNGECDGIRDFFEWNNEIGGVYAGDSESSVIPDKIIITNDTREDVLDYIHRTTKGIALINGKLARETKEPLYLRRYGILSEKAEERDFLLAFDDLEHTQADNREKFTQFSYVGDAGKYDAHNSDIIIYRLLKMMVKNLPRLSRDDINLFLEIRDELVGGASDHSHALFVIGNLDDKSAKEYTFFRRNVYGERNGLFSLDYAIAAYKQVRNENEMPYIYDKAIDELVKIYDARSNDADMSHNVGM